MSEVLVDKVVQIVNRTMPMVEAYLQVIMSKQNINPKQDTSIFERFLINLLEKLADSKFSAKT